MDSNNLRNKHNKLHLVLVLLVCAGVAGTYFYMNNPARKINALLRLGRYKEAVQYYNDHQFSEKDKNNLDQTIESTVNAMMSQWRSEQTNKADYRTTLEAFSEISNEYISKTANGYLDIIRIHDMLNEGKYEEATEYYNTHEYEAPDKQDIDSRINEIIRSARQGWDNGTTSFEEINNSLKAFSNIENNTELMTFAQAQLDYISISNFIREGSYSEAVAYYNGHMLAGNAKQDANQDIDAFLKKAKLNWCEEKTDFEQSKDIFEIFSTINDDSLSRMAKENLKFIIVEDTGNKALAKAADYCRNKDYLHAMTCLTGISDQYSQYKILKSIYESSRTILLGELGPTNTISEYEAVIGKLDSYILVCRDKEFVSKRNELKNELDEYRQIYDILISATNSYEKEEYGKAFGLLESGLQKHPDNWKIQYALSSYQYAYILNISGKVVDQTEKGDYKAARVTLENAITQYDCPEFQELLKQVKMESDIFYATSVKLSEAGDYIYRSGRKMVLGDFAEDEQETILSLGGSVAASIANVDAPLDIRDLAYDMSHWGEGDYFAARLALDAVGILPVIGAIKVLKHADDVVDVAKATGKVADIADAATDVAKTADKADGIHDAAKAADTFHDAVKAADAANDVSDALKASDKIIDQADVVADIRKKAEVVSDNADDIADVLKKADDVKDAAKQAENVSTAFKVANDADTAKDISKKAVEYIPLKTINQNLEGAKHQETGIEFVRRYLDFSDGTHLTGVFPKFQSAVDIELPPELYKASFSDQKEYLKKALKEMAEDEVGERELKRFFDDDAIKAIKEGVIPEGFTWHHNEQEGLMQLVDESIHAATAHTGGMAVWGAGY